MEYLPISFIAGILTVLSPCVFVLLPVILGGSFSDRSWKAPAIIILSLSLSIFLFTLLLKASTLLIDVHPGFWKYLSGGILLSFGLITLFPKRWDDVSSKLGLSSRSANLLDKASAKKGVVGNILVGAALGPVFSSCSPTYAIIVATVIPLEPIAGLINLVAYILGLATILGAVAIFGQALVSKTKWAANPEGTFKKVLGAVLVIVGLAVLTGADKRFETYLLDQGILDATELEYELIDNVKE